MVNPPVSTTFSKGTLVTSTFLNSELDRRGQAPLSYIVWDDGTNFHADSMVGTSDYKSTDHTDAAGVIQNAVTALTNTGQAGGGKIYIKNGLYPINSQIAINGSNIFLEGEGMSANNEASYANSTFNGTMLRATSGFPTGTFNAPNYMIAIGGTGGYQVQGGGMSRMILARTGAYNDAGGTGAIGCGFTLGYVFEDLTFGAYNTVGPTAYEWSGPIFGFDTTVTTPGIGNPTGGWIWVNRCHYSQRAGGREVVRINTAGISDYWFTNNIFFSPPFNAGMFNITNGQSVWLDKNIFYQAGANSAPSVTVNGPLTGLKLTRNHFEQNTNGDATKAFVYLNITNDNFLDTDVGVLCDSNTYFIQSTISTVNGYIYDIEATTANCDIRIKGDKIVNNAVGAITYAKIVPTSNVWIDRPDFMKNVTHLFGFATTTPSVPSTGVAYTNTLGFRVKIYILTASSATYTLTDPYNNTSASMTLSAGQEISLDPGAKITPTYSTLTWKFYGW